MSAKFERAVSAKTALFRARHRSVVEGQYRGLNENEREYLARFDHEWAVGKPLDPSRPLMTEVQLSERREAEYLRRAEGEYKSQKAKTDGPQYSLLPGFITEGNLSPEDALIAVIDAKRTLNRFRARFTKKWRVIGA